MIYTVTLNPSLDYYMELTELVPGKINRSSSEHLQVGGKGINLSKELKELGVCSTVCGFCAGTVGRTIVSEVEKLGLKSLWTETLGCSRINVKLLCNPETAVNGIGCQANIEDLDKLCELINSDEGSIVVFAGAVCKGLGKHAYAYMMSRLKGNFVIDAEKELLTNCLRYKPLFIKPNHIELGQIYNTNINSIEQAIYFGRRLCEEGAQNCIVSLGEKGAIYVTESEAHIVKPNKIEVKSTVGAGDTLLAGIIYGYVKGMSKEESIVFATRLAERKISKI